MSKLATLQNQFIDSLYKKEKPELLDQIKNGKASKLELLNIYRNNLYVTLINALKITYPRIYQFVGENYFRKLCREFIGNNRSNSGNLDDYGEDFADFLLQKNDFFLSDLAKLEWLKHRSYLAENAAVLDIASLQKLPTKRLFEVKFKLHSSCFLLSSNYNLLRKTRPTKEGKKRNYFLVYRQNLYVKTIKILREEYDFLRGIEENLSLYQIYEKHEINIQNCLQKYLGNGSISQFSFH